MPNIPLPILLGLAVLPAVFIVLVCFPRIGLCGIFALVPFSQSLMGDESSINVCATDVLAVLMCIPLIALAARDHRLIATITGLPIMLFLALAAISSAMYWEGAQAAVCLARMCAATMVPVLIFANMDRRRETVEYCLRALMIGVNLLSLLVIGSFMAGGFQAAMTTAGLNKNFAGPMAGCGVGLSMLYLMSARYRYAPWMRVWFIFSLVTSALACLFVLSRGAWVATGAALLLATAGLGHFRTLLIWSLILTPLVLFAWRFMPAEAVDYVTEVSTDKAESTVAARFRASEAILTVFERNPVFGAGVGLRKWCEPHNVVILTLGEMGVVGMIGFLIMFGSGFYCLYRSARSVRGDPHAQLVVMMCLLIYSIALFHGLMDVYWRRGLGIAGWACVGLANNLFVPARVSLRRPRLLRGAAPRWQTAAPAAVVAGATAATATSVTDGEPR